MEYILKMSVCTGCRKIEKMIALTMILCLIAGVIVPKYVLHQWKLDNLDTDEESVMPKREFEDEIMRIPTSLKPEIIKESVEIADSEFAEVIDSGFAGIVNSESAETMDSGFTGINDSEFAEIVNSESAEIMDSGFTGINDSESSEIMDSGAAEKLKEISKNENLEKPAEIITAVKDETSDLSKLNTILPSAFLIDEAGMIYKFRPEYADLSEGYLELPEEGCIGIRRDAFLGCTEEIMEIRIPSNIIRIEDGALCELSTLEWIRVEESNAYYSVKDGVLFDRTGTVLVAYPPARTGAYFVPEEVKDIAENAFLNTSLSIIDVRGCGLSSNCLLNISESCSIIE